MMRILRQVLAVMGVAVVCTALIAAQYYTTKVYIDSGGDRLVVDQGGTLQVSGLIVDVTTFNKQSIAGSTVEISWPGLDGDDALVATLVAPTTAYIHAIVPHNATAMVTFSAAIQEATFGAMALMD
jgi:hypothetical protein